MSYYQPFQYKCHYVGAQLYLFFLLEWTSNYISAKEDMWLLKCTVWD